MNQILSQDEVDALLMGITGESQKLEADDEPMPANFVAEGATVAEAIVAKDSAPAQA